MSASPARKLRGRPARAARARRLQARLGATRLVAHLTGRHIYAQIIAPAENRASRTLFSASTAEKEMRAKLNGKRPNIEAAREIGTRVAQKAVAGGVSKIAFDRGGRKYHGRVKALAEAARKGGLQF